MWIIASGQNAVQIEDAVIKRLLSQYPEEELMSRPAFEHAFSTGYMNFTTLKLEGEKILIPWQLFFLTEQNLIQQLDHIEAQRQNRVSGKLITKRSGTGKVTSKRIIDRLIRQQNFLIKSTHLPINKFCGSLRKLSEIEAANQIIRYFFFDYNQFWECSGKAKALDYLIKKIEDKNINISRGVTSNKILPHSRVVPSEVYKNTSGFVIKDERVPFIFLPSEAANEPPGREIYTLIYLLAVIGLGEYDYFLDVDFKASIVSPKGISKRLHQITTYLLIPLSLTQTLDPRKMNEVVRDNLADQLKVSPLALVMTLRIRGVLSYEDYLRIKPEEYKPLVSSKGHLRSPKVSTSIKKFCGQITFRELNAAISLGQLKSVEAQYLIFGSVNKKAYKKYIKEIRI